MSELERTSAAPERRIFVGIVVAILIIGAILLGVWKEIRQENRAVLGEIAQVEEELDDYRETGESLGLPTLAASEQRTHAALRAQWEALVERVDTFPKATPWLSTGTNTTEEGRIDFKVALYNARTNLQARARESQRAVPRDLGMPETIAADEPAEARLLQLATVVGFMERAIDLGVPTIERIDTLPPLVHITSQDAAVPFAREFPIRVVMQCSFNKLLEMIHVLQQPNSYFALRRFYIHKPMPTDQDPLLVEVVYAGEVFDVLNLMPSDTLPETQSAPTRLPTGVQQPAPIRLPTEPLGSPRSNGGIL